MSEHNENIETNNSTQPEPVTVEATTVSSVNSNPKNNGGFKKVILSVLLVLACGASGYVGGMIQDHTSSQDKVVIQQVTSTHDEENNVTNVSATSALTIEQIAQKCGPSVVEIRTEQIQSGTFLAQYVVDGAGSGVIISEDGYILTNNHVIADATSITVTLSNGQDYQATVIGTDSQSDVAVIKIEASGLTAATIGSSEDLSVGETVVAIGNPLGELGGSVTNGIVSALNRSVTIDGQSLNVLQTNASISPGNSGGGLFNEYGELIGIVNAKSGADNAEGIGFALPINQVMTIATDLINHGYVTNRPAIGITLQTLSYYDGTSSLIVSGFSENSKAQESGLKVGDIIIGADDMSVSSFTDLQNAISSKSIGDTLKLTVVRDNSILSVDVELVEMINTTATQPTPTPQISKQ